MFEGKIIKIKDAIGEAIGEVVACEKDIGITIINAEKRSEYIYCLNMKNSPKFSGARGAVRETRLAFTFIRRGIMNGFVDLTDPKRPYSRYGKKVASSATCAFSS